MFKINSFLENLPKIAEHPLAILAYICVIGVWLLAYYRTRKSKDFLAALEMLPEVERADFARRSGFRYDELSALPQKHRLNLLTKRYRLIGYVVTVLAIVLICFIYIYTYFNSYSQLKTAFITLRNQSDATDKLITHFRLKVEAVRASANTSARLMANPELKRAGEELGKAANDFDSLYHSQLTPEMTWEIRLIRALAANAEGNYQLAENLLSDEDLEKQTMLTANMLLIRADAALGLGQPLKAIELYQRLLRIIPDSIRGLLGVGDCELALGNYGETVAIFNTLIGIADQSTSSLKYPLLSKSLNERGMAYQHLKQFTNAFNDYSQAIAIANQVKNNDEYELNSSTWILYLNRGNLSGEFESPSNAIADLNTGLSLASLAHDDGVYDSNLRNALLLNNRCAEYNYLEQYQNALADINKSIAFFESIPKENISNVQVYFAAALLNRGVSYQNINLYSNSISDFNKSIALCSQFTNSYAYDISLVLIKDWFCLANSLALDDRPQSAIDDYNISLDLLNKLASDGHRELADLAASIYTQLGTTYFQIQNTGEALNNFNKACII